MAAAKVGTTGRLHCQAEGAPDVTFTWKKDGRVLGRKMDGKYHNETVKVRCKKSRNYLKKTILKEA